jgi:HlyD family secretion protein
MKSQALKIGIGVVVIALLGGGAAFWILAHNKADAEGETKSADTRAAAAIVRVHVVKPTQGGVERWVKRPGTVHPYQYAKLYTKVSGYLEKQKVDIGSKVEEGELLAQLFAPELEADVRKAESDLTKAKAHVEVAKAHVTASKAELEQAQDKYAQAQADVQSAHAMTTLRTQEYKRINTLVGQGAVTQELADEKTEARRAAEATERSSEKAVTTAKSGIAAAEAHVTQANAELDDAKAQVKVSQAILDRARSYQQYTQIRSPYTGIVTQRGYHDGDFIRDSANGGANSTPVLTVARTDLMRVVVWVPDPDVADTHAGLPATVEIDALSDQAFHAKVARTAGAEDPASRTMRTEIDLPNPDDLLKDGMYGNVSIDLGPSKKGVTIPAAALHGSSKEGEQTVYVVRDGHAHSIAVKVGRNDGIHAEVLAGLHLDDEVVLQHSTGLSDGAPVEVIDDTKKS